MSAKRRASAGPQHQHHHQQSQQVSSEQQRARSQSLTGSSTFLDGWRSRMPFLKRRQTIDNSRQCQPLMEEGELAGGGAAPLAQAAGPVAADRTTLMTTIAEDVAEAGTAAISDAAATSDASGATGAADNHPNGMGTVIVRMERAGQQHMADEAL
ncbi:hypothetical protein M5D96_009518 [Drosophila gunungcola]|nr:hypothetical protein M5D96_009518 [Drosophila gunungcola]